MISHVRQILQEKPKLITLWVKTKVQNLWSRPPASSVDVANERVESGTRFTYLYSSGYCAQDILRRMDAASSVFENNFAQAYKQSWE